MPKDFRESVRAAYQRGYKTAESMPVELFATLAHTLCTEPEFQSQVDDELITHFDPEVAMPSILATFYDEQSQAELTPDERVQSHREAQRKAWHVLLDASNAAMRAMIDKQLSVFHMLDVESMLFERRRPDPDDLLERARDARGWAA